MAEDHVSPDQHRADLAGLRGELKEKIAGLRQDVVGLAKMIEMNHQVTLLRFEQTNQQFKQVDLQFSRHETRLLSLENWMRTTYVTLANQYPCRRAGSCSPSAADA